jgi:putative addiction module component (TIGR02574 family)
VAPQDSAWLLRRIGYTHRVSLDALLQEAMRLPLDDRATLIGRLLETLDDGDQLTGEAWEAAWSQEIERRVRDIESGAVELVDADDALARVRARIASRR